MTLPPRWRSHLAYLAATKVVESAEQPGSTGWSIIALEHLNLIFAGEEDMVRYECDFCHRLKGNDEAWILGFAAENIGVTAARREVTILPHWDEARAVAYLAVHFCCEQCRQKYMTNLFSEQPAGGEVVEEVAVIPRRRVVREYPGAAVEKRVVRRQVSPRKSKPRRRRKAA